MIVFHRKRGPPGCIRCQELRDEGMKYCLLENPIKMEMVERPVVEINGMEEKYYVEFEFSKIFDSKEELLEFSKGQKVVYTDLD